MTLQLEIDPDTEVRLLAEALARGVPVEEYASSLLRRAIPNPPQGTGVLTPEGFERMSEKMKEWSHKMPVLQLEANDRESFYEDCR